jgi:hypothetical protein
MTEFHGEAAVSNCAREGIPCCYMVLGYSWLQDKPHNYKRYMLQQCTRCGTRRAQIVHWWDIERDICLDCGNQGTTRDSSGVERCDGCGNTNLLILDPKEQPDGSL